MKKSVIGRRCPKMTCGLFYIYRCQQDVPAKSSESGDTATIAVTTIVLCCIYWDRSSKLCFFKWYKCSFQEAGWARIIMYGQPSYYAPQDDVMPPPAPPKKGESIHDGHSTLIWRLFAKGFLSAIKDSLGGHSTEQRSAQIIYMP